MPKLVRADCESEVAIRAVGGGEPFDENIPYEVTCLPVEELSEGWRARSRATFHVRDGQLVLRHRFEGEQEYVVLVETVGMVERQLAAEVRLYALGDDLHAMRPYKGDFHIHSNRSDGHDEPPRVAAWCRQIGMDFMALTDHKRYEPSLEARAAFRAVHTDLGMFPGEEVHAPGNRVHIVNFGGTASVNALFQNDESYAAEVAAIDRELATGLDGTYAYQYASCVWCYRKIREFGGLAIFCHPHWVHRRTYNVPEPLIAQHLADRPFDAYEIIGGFGLHEVESNMLQVARYHDERLAGGPLPIVGASDAHGCERGKLFGWYYTLAFAPSADLGDVIDAVKACNSVAVEALPGQTPRAHGPGRLVKYAQFLLREVFPQHDALCQAEGLAMHAHLDGKGQAADQLAALSGRTAALLDAVIGPAAP